MQVVGFAYRDVLLRLRARSADWPVVAGLLLLLGAWVVLDGSDLVGRVVTTGVAYPLALFAAPALLLLPGLAVLRLLWVGQLRPDQRWPLALGISSALPPLLLLVSESVGVRWNSALAWGYIGVSALVVFWPRRTGDWTADARSDAEPSTLIPIRHHTRNSIPGMSVFVFIRGIRGFLLFRHRICMNRYDAPTSGGSMQSMAVLLIITLAAILVRLYAARDLPVGMWGDSYHHTVIAQLLVDHGGLFSSWQPYAPLMTFTYHFGFHSLVAWFTWLTGIPVTASVLIIGQVQSALAAPLIYIFTVQLLDNRVAGLWAALLVGLVLPMPAYYLNWGRYTQLAGQTILPVVCVAWMALLEQRDDWRQHGRLVGLALLVTAGLALTHYRVAVFAAAFVAAYTGYLLLVRIRSLRAVATLAATGLVTGLLSLLLIAPWLLRLREGKLLLIGQNFARQNIGLTQTNSLMPPGELLTLHAPWYLVGLAGLGIVLLVWRRAWQGLVLPVWVGLVWLAANPYLIGLGGAGILTNHAVLNAGYLVLAPLAGLAIAGLFGAAGRIMSPRWCRGVQIFGATCVVLIGMAHQQRIGQPDQFQLVTAADMAAMQWIRQETPPDARFFVNSFPAYQGSLYAGTDGGWWLPFLSGRQSNVPPITYGSEAGLWPYSSLAVNRVNRDVQRYALDSPAAVAALRVENFSYLYDGPAAHPADEYINPHVLAQSALYELVYSHDGVTIWRVR